jgi:hypothetical protein
MSHNHSCLEFILQEESYITIENSVRLVITQTLKPYILINKKYKHIKQQNTGSMSYYTITQI